MSQKQDLLFCKIAITNGRITQDQAKKCLAIAKKRELETGRRPSIGSVFSKYNLMHKQEVNAIYEAIAKRTGIAPPSVGAPVAGAGRGGSQLAARGRKPSFADDRPRRVDPNTLWLGVAFGVIFLGIVVGLVIMFITHDPAGEEDTSKTAGSGAAAAAGTTPGGADPAPGGSASTASGRGTIPDTSVPVVPAVMNETQRRKIRQVLTDARQDSLVDSARALSSLKKLQQEIDKQKIFVDPGLLAEIATEMKNLKSDLSGDTGSDSTIEDKLPDLDDDL